MLNIMEDPKLRTSFHFSRKQLDAITKMAEKLDLKKAKIVRMALADFFKKHKEVWPSDSDK